jgi:hypothetical protein
MKFLLHRCRCAVLAAFCSLFLVPQAMAGGEVGDHVNHLSDNIDQYTSEVKWLVEKVDAMVARYEQGGLAATRPDALVEYWEAVDFHAAIETNYVPLYASIWQGLYGVKTAIEKSESLAKVRLEQSGLEIALWQSLGAVKVAGQYQARGLLEKIALREGGPGNAVEALDEVAHRLDRVVAKYAEKLNKEAVTIVHDTYLNLFEGVEGELIAQDADLVADLEKDFNVTLPNAIEANGGVDSVRAVVVAMQEKLARAKSLLESAQRKKKDVF